MGLQKRFITSNFVLISSLKYLLTLFITFKFYFMKRTIFLLIGFAGLFLFGCKKTDVTTSASEPGIPTDLAASDFRFSLQSVGHENNKTSFVWKLVNINPWSAQNPTGTKDLKEWSLVFKGDRIPGITGAFYGSSLATLTPIASLDYTPVTGSCFTGNAFKYNYGTTDGEPSYYVLVVQGNYNAGISYAVTSDKAQNCSKLAIKGVFTDIQ
jgi:hypothetical protein